MSKKPPWRLESPTAVLTILALMNIINYADRALMSPIAPLLEAPHSAGGLGLSKSQIGLIGSAFMVVHSLASVPLGILADRFTRKYLIAIGVGLWSVATATAGFARGFTSLFIARASVGVGEATYAPAASALISDTFSPAVRARALAVFQMGMVLGGGIGTVVGGLVANSYGWRNAFFAFGLPGVVIALLVLLIGEKPRTAADIAMSQTLRRQSSFATQAKGFMKSKAWIWINVSGIFITFFVGALVFWGPTFILESQYGGKVELLGRAATTFGGIAVPMAVAGALVGSLVADRLDKKRPGEGRLRAVAYGTIAVIPLTLIGVFATQSVVVFGAMGLAVFFMSWYVGPILAALHEVVGVDQRGVATGAYLLLVHLLGDAISPWVVGQVASSTGSLRIGLVCATGALAFGAGAALLALPHARKIAGITQGR